MATRFYYDNLWQDHTITPSSEHPNFPATNTQGRAPSRGWRSRYGAGSGWGTFTVSAGVNDRIDFEETNGANLVATLTAGIYTSTTFVAEIKARLDAAGASTYTPSYSDTTNKIAITSSGTGGGGLFKLMWQSGPNTARTAGGIMGYDITANDTGALTYTADYARIHSQETLSIDLGATWASHPVHGAMVVGHNLQAGATAAIQASSDNWTTVAFSAPFTIQDYIMGIAWEPPGYSFQYWRYWIQDPTNPDGYVDIAPLFLGPGFQPSRRYRRGRSRTPVDLSLIKESQNGNETSIQKAIYWNYDYGFNAVDGRSRAAFQAEFRALLADRKFSRPFFFSEDTDDLLNTLVYGRLQNYSENQFQVGEWWDVALSIKEMI